MKNNSFLYIVAENLLSRFGTNLSEIVIVLPNIKTKIFINQYLYQLVKKPLWSPQYKTVESLLQEFSSLQIGEEIQLISELYLVYSKVYKNRNLTPFKKKLDNFFCFGETLLKDFDEIDKNRINASLLYCNFKDLDTLKNIFSFFSENQIQTLVNYFKKTFQRNTILQINFQNIWNLLGEVYSCFKCQLQKKKIAYSGMLIRQVIEQKEIFFSGKHYAFIGFNILNQCEKSLFMRLKEKSSFYWDYDSYYLNTEAGKFIKENISLFGSVLKEEKFNNFLFVNKKINFISSPSQSGQTAIIPKWIERSILQNYSFLQKSAIILCNESIFPVVIEAISSKKIENTNIKIGIPLFQTTIGSFMLLWLEMQTKGYRHLDKSFKYTYVLPILRHPYCHFLLPNAAKIEKKIQEKNIFFLNLSDLQNQKLFTFAPDVLSLIYFLMQIVLEIGKIKKKKTNKINYGLEQESIFQAHQMLSHLHFVFSSNHLNLKKTILIFLLKKYLSKVKIFFENKPLLEGLQIMDILETHMLDFNHILILNTNEGNMPSSIINNGNTFIPFLLRKHFGMNTQEHHDSIYAYYFYRLISRVEKVTLVYPIHETSTGKSEISRFLLQLLIDIKLKNRIKRFILQSNSIPIHFQPIQIEKTPFLIQKIKKKYNLEKTTKAKVFSPSSLSRLIECSYRFYLEYIQELKKPNHPNFNIDPSTFGILFHRSAELLYRDIGIGTPIYSKILEKYIHSPQKIRAIVLKSFQQEIFKERKVLEKNYSGEQLINAHILCKMLTRLLRFDLSQTPFTILGLEIPLYDTLLITGGENKVRIKGTIDRLQKESDGKHRIIDYKTGNKEIPSKNLFDWFGTKYRSIFQILTYTMLYTKIEKQNTVVSTILYVQKPEDKYSLSFTQNENKPEDFSKKLSKKIEELFIKSIPFSQTENFQICHSCPFKERCNR